MSAQSTSTASFLLASSRLPRFQSQSLRAPTKPPYRSASPYCLWFRGVASPTLLAPMSGSALPPRVTAAPPLGLEAKDESGQLADARTVAVARMCSALVAAWCQRALAVRAAAAGAHAGASGAVEAAVGVGWAALRGCWPTVLQILQLLREQDLVLALLLGLFAFFFMDETFITTLWPWKAPFNPSVSSGCLGCRKYCVLQLILVVFLPSIFHLLH